MATSPNTLQHAPEDDHDSCWDSHTDVPPSRSNIKAPRHHIRKIKSEAQIRFWGQQAVLYELMLCHGAFILESDDRALVWLSPTGMWTWNATFLSCKARQPQAIFSLVCLSDNVMQQQCC